MNILSIALMLVLAMPAPPAETHDYPGIKMQMQLIESLVTTAIKQHFQNPFGILQQVKGTYLDGFGVVFTAEVNLYQMRTPNPFNRTPYSEKELSEARAQKLAHNKEAATLMQDLLRDHGAGLTFLRADENVAVVLHLYNVPELSDMPSQIVVQTKRQTLIDAAAQKLTAAEFRNRASVVTF